MTFEENYGDFAVLLTKSDERVLTTNNTRIVGSESWAGIALLDLETLSVDYFVYVDLAPVEVDAIALRRLSTRSVCALSTAGFVVTAGVLF